MKRHYRLLGLRTVTLACAGTYGTPPGNTVYDLDGIRTCPGGYQAPDI